MQTVFNSFVVMVTLLTVGCQDGTQSREASSGSGNGSGVSDDTTFNAAEVKAKREDAGTVTSAADMQELFLDSVSFEKSEFSYVGGCDNLFKDVDFPKELHAWPAKLKQELVQTLVDFNQGKMISESIRAYYLINAQTMAGASAVDSDDPAGAAGLFCPGKDGAKGMVFLSYKTFVTDASLDSEIGLSSSYTTSDQGVPYHYATLIHESLHAIDFKFFIGAKTGDYLGDRLAASKLSWNTYDDSKYNSISVMALADASTLPGVGRKFEPCIWSKTFYSRNIGFGLTADARTEAADLKYMATKTNYIAPYTMANGNEDFAESLTIYYFGTRAKKWPKWRTYDQDLTVNTPDPSKLIYTFDAGRVIKTSKAHRKKLCALAELIFAEDCEAKLP